MTQINFYAKRGSPSKIAIWEGEDDAPFEDPIANLARVRFHSSLLYLPIVATLTNTFTSAATDSSRVATHVVGYHGRGGIPLVFGYVVGTGENGRDLPLVGSVPVFRDSNNNAIMWTLGANAGQVIIHESRSRPNNMGAQTAKQVVAFVSNYILE